jgi:hypothetical protein
MEKLMSFSKISAICFTIFSIFITSCSKSSNLSDLIGLNINSKQVQEYLNVLGTYEISKYEDNYFYIFLNKGIDFSISKKDKITAIFLFSEGVDGHRQYSGSLPYNIQFTDTRKVVETKLGPPDAHGGGSLIDMYSDWYKKGISITYKTLNQEDMTTTIKNLTIIKFK